ncbi:hypothetical protein FRC02_000797 [Tulasnella sp. 418]|nr:hypothetical protein FRC02_000797 [Tulasnella sp. 418]
MSSQQVPQIPSATLKFRTSLALTLHPISPPLSSLHTSRSRLLNPSSSSTTPFDQLGCTRCGGLSCTTTRIRRNEDGGNQIVNRCSRCGSKKREDLGFEEQKMVEKSREFPSVRIRARMKKKNVGGAEVGEAAAMSTPPRLPETLKSGSRHGIGNEVKPSASVKVDKAVRASSSSEPEKSKSPSLAPPPPPSLPKPTNNPQPSAPPQPESSTSSSKRSKKKAGLQQMIARHKEQQLQKQKQDEESSLQSGLSGFLSSL